MSEEDSQNTNIQADNNSTAVGSVTVGGSVDGSLIIGSHNVVGFTSDQVSTLIAQISTTFQPKPFDGRSPYKGLDVFEEEDAELFFGREKLVEDVISRAKESRTAFVTGRSGSGKSSLARRTAPFPTHSWQPARSSWTGRRPALLAQAKRGCGEDFPCRRVDHSHVFSSAILVLFIGH